VLPSSAQPVVGGREERWARADDVKSARPPLTTLYQVLYDPLPRGSADTVLTTKRGAGWIGPRRSGSPMNRIAGRGRHARQCPQQPRPHHTTHSQLSWGWGRDPRQVVSGPLPTPRCLSKPYEADSPPVSPFEGEREPRRNAEAPTGGAHAPCHAPCHMPYPPYTRPLRVRVDSSIANCQRALIVVDQVAPL